MTHQHGIATTSPDARSPNYSAITRLPRTLPMHVAPLPGESLDSWLEAIAHRHQCRFKDLLAATSIRAHPQRNDWLVALSPDERRSLATATAVGEDVLTAMTLEHYDGRALDIELSNRTLRRSFPWGWRTGSRFCPRCLADNGGRWQLVWRLNWTFACTRHHCLLTDACPQCGARQRHQPHAGTSIPEPGNCRKVRTPPNTPRHRCGAALSSGDVLVMPHLHPVLAAQRLIETILTGCVSAFPIYQNGRHASREVLADIQALARWIITAVDHGGLRHYVPRDVLASLTTHRTLLDWPYGMYWNSVAALPETIDTAVGVTVATSVLAQPNTSLAAIALQRLKQYAAKRRPYSLPISPRRISPVLTTIQSTAMRHDGITTQIDRG